MQHQPHFYHTANDSFVFAAPPPPPTAESVKNYPPCASLSFPPSAVLLAAILISLGIA